MSDEPIRACEKCIIPVWLILNIDSGAPADLLWISGQ